MLVMQVRFIARELKINYKGGKMTPLHLDILIHYYGVAIDYPMVKTNDCRRDYANYLMECGLLYKNENKEDERTYLITKFGRHVVDKILGNFADIVNF